jgi:hypothetical protein
MQRLFDLAIIVVEIGEICRAHNLKEEDLPAHFRLIFQSIHTFVSKQSILRGLIEYQRATWYRGGFQRVCRDQGHYEAPFAPGHASKNQAI